jgi:hypothetical protein
MSGLDLALLGQASCESRRTDWTMNRRHLVWILGLVACCQGCSTWWSVGRTAIVQPACFPAPVDRLHSYFVYHHLAKRSFAKYQADHKGEPISRDFAKGYVDGFTRLIEKGGPGNPPAVPPRCYWRVNNRTPDGHDAAQEWFTGFRVGTAAAMETGIRNVTTVATSIPPKQAAPDMTGGLAQTQATSPDLPVLPLPRENNENPVPEVLPRPDTPSR